MVSLRITSCTLGLFHLRLLSNQPHTYCEHQRGAPFIVVGLVKDKVVRIELRPCVGEEVGPRNGIGGIIAR